MQVMSFLGPLKVALCHISIFSVNNFRLAACKGRWLWSGVILPLRFISPPGQQTRYRRAAFIRFCARNHLKMTPEYR